MIHLYFYDPGLYSVYSLTDWDLNSLYLNQYGRLVQLVAQEERNIGFVHFQTPANTEAIQIAACVVGWVRREQKYYGACKLLTKAEDNMQPENCETDSKADQNSQSGYVNASSDVEESGFSGLRIKDHCRGIHTELVGSGWSEGILIYRVATWDHT